MGNGSSAKYEERLGETHIQAVFFPEILSAANIRAAAGHRHFALFAFRLLVHEADGLFVNDHVGPAIADDLQATAVVPLDDAVHAFAVLEHDDHRRFGLHLLLIIEV